MLSNRRVETRLDYERKCHGDDHRSKRSRIRGQQENGKALLRHWPTHHPITNNSPTGSRPNKFRRKLLSKFQPKTRQQRPSLRYRPNLVSPPISPNDGAPLYRVKIVSPQPPQRIFGAFSDTCSNSTDVNLESRDDSDQNSGLSYYSSDEKEMGQAQFSRRYTDSPENPHYHQKRHLHIIDTKEATKHIYSSRHQTPNLQQEKKQPPRLSLTPKTMRNGTKSKKSQDRPIQSSKVAKSNVNPAFGVLCCAMYDCTAVLAKKPSLMSLSRRRIPGMKASEEHRLWREAFKQDLRQDSVGVIHLEDDPTIDKIEVVPVDTTFNSQGGFSYTEREGVGMLFAPGSMPQTPDALPWWKRDNWTNITEEGGAVTNTMRTANAYNKGYRDCFNFNHSPKTLLQQTRDDRASHMRVDGQTHSQCYSIFRPSANVGEIDRRNQQRMGYFGSKGGANKFGRKMEEAKDERRRLEENTSSKLYQSLSASDLDESLEDRVARLDQLRLAERRRTESSIETFRPRIGGRSSESEFTVSLDVPHLNHDYKASHFELRAKRYGSPYVVEALHEVTKESPSSNDLSELPSGSDLSSVVKVKYAATRHSSFKKHEIQSLAAKTPEVTLAEKARKIIQINHTPTEDSTIQHLGEHPTRSCCNGGMLQLPKQKLQKMTFDTELDPSPNRNAFKKDLRLDDRLAQKTGSGPKHVIFVDDGHDGMINHHRKMTTSKLCTDAAMKSEFQKSAAMESDTVLRTHTPPFRWPEKPRILPAQTPFEDTSNMRCGSPTTHRTVARSRISSPVQDEDPNRQPTRAIPTTRALGSSERHPLSPIKLYGDPPEMRREDGSPVVNPRALYLSGIGTPVKDMNHKALGEELNVLLAGLSPRRTERSEGLILFKPTINVFAPDGKNQSTVGEDKKDGSFVTREGLCLRAKSKADTPSETDDPCVILSAENEYMRRDRVEVKNDPKVYEYDDMERHQKQRDTTSKRVCWGHGLQAFPPIKRYDRQDETGKPLYFYNGKRRICDPDEHQATTRRSFNHLDNHVYSRAKPESQRKAAPHVIDLSCVDDVRSLDEEPAQHANTCQDPILDKEIRFWPNPHEDTGPIIKTEATSSPTHFINHQQNYRLPPSPSQSSAHAVMEANTGNGSTRTESDSLHMEQCFETDLSFIERKPMIPLGLSIKDYTSSTPARFFEPTDVNERKARPFSELRVDADLSWKTVQNLYRITPTEKSEESLEKVFSGQSIDEGDQNLQGERQYKDATNVMAERERQDQNNSIPVHIQEVENASVAISSFGHGNAIASESTSLSFVDSISSAEECASVIDLGNFLDQSVRSRDSLRQASDIVSIKHSSDARFGSTEKKSRQAGQKIYAELLRRGRIGIERPRLSSSQPRAPRSLEPITEGSEPYLEDVSATLIDKATEQRNAAVSRLRRLRKLQTKLQPIINEVSKKTPSNPQRVHVPATQKQPAQASMKDRLDEARKRIVKGSTVKPADSQQESRNLSLSRKGDNEMQDSNSLIKVYIQSPMQVPAVKSTPVGIAKPRTGVAQNSNPKPASSFLYNKITKEKLVSAMPTHAKARSAAAAKPGSLLWEAASKARK